MPEPASFTFTIVLIAVVLVVALAVMAGFLAGRRLSLRDRSLESLEKRVERVSRPELAAPGAVETLAAPDVRPGLLQRLSQGLARTREALGQKLDVIFSGSTIDAALMENLEDALIQADVGAVASRRIVDELRRQVRSGGIEDPSLIRDMLRRQLIASLQRLDSSLRSPPEAGPHVILVVGINGGGKTTTIGKLAARFGKQGRKVILGAGDTYRAGAIEQLKVWAERAGSDIVVASEGADPASVIYDTLLAAKARGCDTVIADTAGRLQNRKDLMGQLGKVVRVISRAIPGAPHEVLLVLDATIGQNALSQARIFGEVVGVTGLVLTKLDGTARGGVVIAVCEESSIPVKFIGVGEKMDDLRPFEPTEFVDALLGEARTRPGFRE